MLARIRTLLLPLLAAAVLAANASAHDAPGGTLDAVGRDGRPLGNCPLEHTDVSVEIAGFFARVSVTQRFANPFPDPIEAIYTFPLSERAAVDAMSIRSGDRTIRGEIRTREAARQAYEQARAAGKTAALLDEERPNVFTQSVANLMPGTAVTVHIEYVETLAYEDGRFAFSFPTVVGPRFVPGGGRVPDAARLAPPIVPEGTRAGHDISVAVTIDAGVPIGEIASALHEIDVERSAASRARVVLRNQAELPNRDFVLRYEVASDRVQSTVLAHRAGAEPGYATFVLVPPRRVPAAEAAPRELVFVVDRSGSQSGAPLAKAKETLLWMLDRMNPQDTFQIVSFSSSAEWLFAEPAPPTHDAKRRARAYVEALTADGGTYMAEAVQAIAAQPAPGNRLRIVTFMTDGYVGHDLEVLALVRSLRGNSRWFPFGTGNAVNRFLLDRMAKLGGGEAEYVLLNASGEEVARRFWERVGTPVLTDVRIEVDGLALDEVYPRELGDVWAERPLVLHARYASGGRGRVVLRGFRRGEPFAQSLDVDLPDRETGNEAIASLWARAKVDALLERDLCGLQRCDFDGELRKQVETVALAHRLLTPFTSFVAVDDRVVNGRLESTTVPVPVEMPEGVEYEGVGAGTAYHLVAPSPATNGGIGRARVEQLRSLGYLAGPAEPKVEASRDAHLRALGYVDPSLPEPSATALARIAPALHAFFTDAWPTPAFDVTGRGVLVKVRVRDLDAARIAALEKTGLAVAQRLGDTVVGRVPLDRLGTLAELDFVVMIDPG
jgi:Ca-activated chloride channel family protein